MIAGNEEVVACAKKAAAIIDGVPLIASFAALRVITGQLKIIPLEAFRMEAGVPSIALHAQQQAAMAYDKAHRLPTNQAGRKLLDEPCRQRMKRPGWCSMAKALVNRRHFLERRPQNTPRMSLDTQGTMQSVSRRQSGTRGPTTDCRDVP